MDEDRKQKLIDVGAEKLATALLDLALHSKSVDDLVERLTATPKENIQRVKRKLAGLKRATRFIDWRNQSNFVRELIMLLQDVKDGANDPLTGLKLVAAFYECDDAIFNRSDDSNGTIGDVFRFEAKELFAELATNCGEKEKIADIILELNLVDDYGIRDSLVDCCGDFLPEQVIRSMIAKFQTQVESEKDQFAKGHWWRLVESLARQIKDAKLFEKTRKASSGKRLSTAAHTDIARVYLESGEVETAQSWLNKVPVDATFMSHERDLLHLEIYRRQGNTEKLTDLLYQKFQKYHSSESLQALLDVVGEDKRDEIVAKEVAQILENTELQYNDVEFLIEIGKMDEAENYLLKHADQLDGYLYQTLPPLAEAMEAENRPLATSLIYRALLISILERGYAKAYSHGIRHLKKLDALASNISDWKNFDHHEAFKERIFQTHGRKHSFWSKYQPTI